MTKIRCNMCTWEGDNDELEFGEDDEGYFHGCPNCETDQYLMDLEDDET